MAEAVATFGRAIEPGRNDPCPCRSGAKWKRCHGQSGGPPAGAAAILGGAGPDAPRGQSGLCVVLDAGAGDAIHAMRHLHEFRPTFVVVRREMARLFQHNFPFTCVTAYPLPAAAHTVHTLSLIGRKGAPTRLTAPAPRVFPQDGQRRVGICARGDRTQAFDRWRSIHDPSVLNPLFRLPGIDWYDLAAGPFGDWADTANLVAGLELVISVDTGVAHLAGALGKPLLLLDRAPGPGDPGPDDRWDEDWLQPGQLYPGAVRFRQVARGDWSGPIAAATTYLAAL